MRVAGDYRAGSTPLRTWCLRFKHAGRADLAAELGALLVESWEREQSLEPLRVDAWVPVPLHWSRRWERGYDQAGLLARELARGTGVRVRRALLRRRATAPQGVFGGGTRMSNVHGAFAVKRGSLGSIRGADVWLVDDVATSLATAEACAEVLRRAGARSVSLLVLARAEFRSGNSVGRIN